VLNEDVFNLVSMLDCNVEELAFNSVSVANVASNDELNCCNATIEAVASLLNAFCD
jgi:hypothetical protein